MANTEESHSDDLRFMARALFWAQHAAEQGEVPVGAVLVQDGAIIAEAGNAQIGLCDPTAHAEILTLRRAASVCANYRLPNTTLYVTLEPCTMCCGALVHARVSRLVFAAYEPKAGAVTSTAHILDQPVLNHRVKWQGGVLEQDSAELLQAFFRARREQRRLS